MQAAAAVTISQYSRCYAENARKKKDGLWVATLDFAKAFDTVHHSALINALNEQGMDHTYLDLLQRLYGTQEAEV